MKQEIWHGDCLELMKDILDGSVDAIICDLPYGVTARNKWDVIIPFDKLWESYERIIKNNGAIVLTASQPFTTLLISSNIKDFKYCWTWDKVNPTGFLNAKKQPLRRTEDVVIFYRSQPVYNPQMEKRGKPRVKGGYNKLGGSENYGHFNDSKSLNNDYYPTNILNISNAARTGRAHPTQKPVALMEYLIKTYTNEGDLVLDNCAGSGTTGIAAKNLNRRFILIEKEKEYYDICLERLGKC